MPTEPWIIVGGGIAGLTAAIALAKSGIQSNIHEKSDAFLPIGAGLQLGPNAVRALQNIGAWDHVASRCTTPEEIHIRDGKSGKTLQRLKLGNTFASRFGAPYRVILRADLHAALLACCSDETKIIIKMGSTIAHDSASSSSITLAADGIWSPIREKLFPTAKAVILPTTIHRSLMNIKSSTQTQAVTLWLYPHGHVVHYDVGNPVQRNIVAVIPGQSQNQGWNQNQHNQAIISFFQNACTELQDLLAAQKQWLSWPAAHVANLPSWHNDKTLLIGDAAHGTVPYLAQGAAMAIEDAACLQQLLTKSLSTPALFAAFTALRKPRTDLHHHAAIKNAKAYHANGITRLVRNAILANTPAGLFLNRLSWLYAH